MTDFKKQKTAVALGTFDGLHKGHMSVINNAVVRKNDGLTPVIMLFSEHPLKVLTGSAPKEIFTGSIKKREIEKTGCVPFVVPFEKIHTMSPDEFFTDILMRELNAGFVSCGFNFKFGRNGAGNTEILSKLCSDNGIALSVAEEIDYKGECVSSTRIRKAITDGNIEDANGMLGRYFSYDFTVVEGDKRGGKVLGFPTINQFFPDDFIVPRFGVYASAAYVDGKIYPAMTNIGVRPTIGHSKPRSETSILGFSGDLYGTNTEVCLLSYLRREIRFETLNELSEQMKRDSEKSIEIFKKEGLQ